MFLQFVDKDRSVLFLFLHRRLDILDEEVIKYKDQSVLSLLLHRSSNILDEKVIKYKGQSVLLLQVRLSWNGRYTYIDYPKVKKKSSLKHKTKKISDDFLCLLYELH